VAGWFGEVEAGDLEAVEEQAGAAGVDVVGGDALQDFSDGGLDGGAVFGEGQVEGGAAAAALAWVRDGFAGGVVVVAELLLAEAWAGAAVSVGEDVAALVLLGRFVGVVHVPLPTGYFLCKVFEGQEIGPDFLLSGFAVKCEGPAFGRATSIYFYFIEWDITKRPVSASLFLARKFLIFSCLWDLPCGFSGLRGLTCEFGRFFEGFQS
jgi:hypothetical protein